MCTAYRTVSNVDVVGHVKSGSINPTLPSMQLPQNKAVMLASYSKIRMLTSMREVGFYKASLKLAPLTRLLTVRKGTILMTRPKAAKMRVEDSAASTPKMLLILMHVHSSQDPYAKMGLAVLVKMHVSTLISSQ